MTYYKDKQPHENNKLIVGHGTVRMNHHPNSNLEERSWAFGGIYAAKGKGKNMGSYMGLKLGPVCLETVATKFTSCIFSYTSMKCHLSMYLTCLS